MGHCAYVAPGGSAGYTLHMPKLAQKKPTKTPRKQHPFLVGCTFEEAGLISAEAARRGVGPITFMRDLALKAASRAGK